LSEDPGNLLKRRALAFLETAKFNLDKANYDLAIFSIEQFMQLYTKYLLFKKIGDYPKTHSLTHLLRTLNQLINSKLSSFIDKNLGIINFLEEAYISSRYLPRRYDEDIASKAYLLSKEALEVFEWIEKNLY